MKRILPLLLIILFAGCATQKQTHRSIIPSISVGTVANDGTGTPLRTAMQRILTSFAETEDSLQNRYTKPQTRNLVNDSLDRLRYDALPLNSYAPLWSDTSYTYKQIITYNQLLNYEGGGSGISYGKLALRVDSNGLSSYLSGDSTLTETSFIGKHIEVYRNGSRQIYKDKSYYVNSTVEFNSSTGRITFHPPLETNEQIIVEVSQPINWETLYLTGSENDLLTGLRACWSLDESTGTSLSEEVNDYTATSINGATVGANGIDGRSVSFARASAQYLSAGTTVGDVGTSDFTYSAWVYIPTLSGNNMGILGNWQEGFPFYYLMIDSYNYIYATINFGGSNIVIVSDNPITASEVTNIIVTHDRSGLMTMYVNGQAQTTTADISASSVISIANASDFNIGCIGNAYSGANYYFNGTIDEPAIWTRVITADEIATINFGETGDFYPWE